MKLRNKKTGEIIETCEIFENLYGKIRIRKDGIKAYDYKYDSLAELNAEWEDVLEEPKWLEDYWFMDSCGGTVKQEGDVLGSIRREIGNYFRTKEEAELAVEKLKAWKRLKDKGFRFERWFKRWIVGGEYNDETRADLDLLFGGEE